MNAIAYLLILLFGIEPMTADQIETGGIVCWMNGRVAESVTIPSGDVIGIRCVEEIGK